jgi:hypothetical protein
MVTTTTQKDRTLRKSLAQRSSAKKKKNMAIIGAVMAAATIITHFQSHPDPIPMRTSILTGRMWLAELLESPNPTWFQEQMGMTRRVFHKLSYELQMYSGLANSKYVTADEQLAIYAHLARTGLSSRMLQERFQRSGDTISVYVL